MFGSKAIKAILGISGIILLGVGSALLATPAAMHAKNGIILDSDPSLLSEVRAPGGALLACGAIVLAGVFVPRLRDPATIIAATVYGAYGISRLVSMAVDGMPAPGLVGAAGLEIVLGAANLLLLSRRPPLA